MKPKQVKAVACFVDVGELSRGNATSIHVSKRYSRDEPGYFIRSSDLPQIVEQMARAIHETDGGWGLWQADARAALASFLTTTKKARK